MKRTLLIAGVFAVVGGFAQALTADDVIADLSGQGYTRIEIKTGPSQMKVEAIRGTEKLEVVYDRASGDVLKTETEMVDDRDNTVPGVSVRERSRDFVRERNRERVRDGNPSRGHDSDDDHGQGRGSDDDSDDDHGRGSDDHGSDDHGSDDHGSDDHGRGDDDHGSDDHGGDRDRGSDDD